MYEEGSVVLVRDLFCFVLFNLDFYISLNFNSDSILLLVFGYWYEICCVCFWCLTPIWKIIQLYTGGQLYWWIKAKCPQKTTDVVFNVHCLFPTEWPSWSCSHGSWIYNYQCNQCISPLKLWVRIPRRRGVLNTTLWDKVYQWLAAGLWFSPGTGVSSTNKTYLHHITEILWR